MPKAYLKNSAQNVYSENCLANFCFISRANNRLIGGEKPSIYKAKMTGDVAKILESHVIPTSLFDDNYENFINERAELLANISENLCA
ncbi:hypothetical protein [Cronobacter dublinensis]|nr:hypothetical protein [Cronobacter dublinensis]